MIVNGQGLRKPKMLPQNEMFDSPFPTLIWKQIHVLETSTFLNTKFLGTVAEIEISDNSSRLIFSLLRNVFRLLPTVGDDMKMKPYKNNFRLIKSRNDRRVEKIV